MAPAASLQSAVGAGGEGGGGTNGTGMATDVPDVSLRPSPLRCAVPAYRPSPALASTPSFHLERQNKVLTRGAANRMWMPCSRRE